MKRPSRLAHLASLGVDRMAELADSLADPSILRMENIDTDLRPYEPALKVARDAVDDDRANSYLPLLGRERLRRAVAAHVGRASGIPYDWARSTVIAPGAWSALLNILLATVEPGEGVLLTEPVYAGLLNRVRLVSATPELVPFRPTADGWRLDIDLLRAVAARPGVRVMMMMNPNLPSGAVLNAEEWGAVAEVCQRNDLLLVYDAALERVLFDGRQVLHPASLPGMAERTVTIGTVSKELRMIGWRVGWIVGPPEIIADATVVGLTNAGGQVGLSQEAAAVALEAPDDDVNAAVAEWQRRRDVLLRELDGIVPVTPPHGGWTMMLDVGALGMSGSEASRRCLEKGGIAATPMDNWGAAENARYLRLVFSKEPVERLVGFGDRIRRSLLG